jgi:ubiquinone/menaquinone biosynthesis C-methylase UbiE
LEYVHGYSIKENNRLQDQASTLTELLLSDTLYPVGSNILEAGCGVGAQTITLAQNNPESFITSIDISEYSIGEAKRKIELAGIKNVKFQQGDIYNLPFTDEKFDHIFICFVLEHLQRPKEALIALKSILKVNGAITVIEGDHGSVFFYPNSSFANKAIQCQLKLQEKAKGNTLIGRELYPLLKSAGFNSVHVSPRVVYVDNSKPELVEGFTKKTFIAMIEGIREAAINEKIIDPGSFDKGVKDLYRTTKPDGVFYYTFFKAIATKDL